MIPWIWIMGKTGQFDRPQSSEYAVKRGSQEHLLYPFFKRFMIMSGLPLLCCNDMVFGKSSYLPVLGSFCVCSR